MNRVEDLGTVISTDVLVLGGGGAGLCAAIKAAESKSDVLVVDKCGIGFSGEFPIGGGIIKYVYPDQAEEWCRQVTEQNGYFNNQDWTYAIATGLHKAIHELADLGVKFLKSEGEIAIFSFEKGDHVTFFEAPKSLVQLKKAAISRGVKTLDKVYGVDLLKRDDRVVGAVGLGLVDGKTYLFNAKAVIVAVGGCGFMHEKTFGGNLGEGLAMAYRAGAELLNPEFGGGYVYGAKALGKQFMGIHVYLRLENRLGENIMRKYYPEVFEQKQIVYTHDPRAIDAMMKEVSAGRGPIYLDLRNLTAEEKTYIIEDRIEGLPQILANDNYKLLKEKAGIDPEKENIEMVPYYLRGGGGGGLKVDTECRSTLPGLWAVGRSAHTESGIHGGGIGIGSSLVTGLRAGESAGKQAPESRRQELEFQEVKRTRDRIVAPLGRTESLGAHEVIHQVHGAIVPMKYNFYREAAGLKEALAIIASARENLARIGARDFHELSRYHQAESMVLAADLTYRAALIREESRSTQRREDFPARDDKNWRKWTIVRQKNGIPDISTQPIPVDKYRFRPR
ncbi:MAG: FAD-binding protein [Syntrophorhabdales bacterium]|jgi:succinate dehydrogenase/fumarate reductase flavoprotein subunit